MNIPNDTENRGVATGIDQEGIHRSASLSHPPPQFTNPGHALKISKAESPVYE